MQLVARDIMDTNFDTIHADVPTEQAIRKIFNAKVRPTEHKSVSLMVVDDLHKLVGTISMYYILYHLRPSFLNYGFDGNTLNWKGELDQFISGVKDKKVRQVMNHNIFSVGPDEPLMTIVDRMVKDRIRRMPVAENSKLIGVVYLSDIFYHLFHE